MVTLGDSIYIIGGLLCRRVQAPNSIDESDEFIDVGVEVLPSVLRYNCTLNAWSPLPSMSTLRYKSVGVTWRGKIHVVGGFAMRRDSDKTVPFITERSSAEVYDPRTGKWDLVTGMWQLDVPPNQIVEVDGSLFSSAYDGKLNIWNVVDGSHSQTLNSPISPSDDNNENWPPTQRVYLTMAPIGTRLYFLAGYRKAGESSRIISMDLIFYTRATRRAWASSEPMEEEGV
ncbi:kelch-like protein 8 [Populus alba x Populus x berolinensis]|nr:kelch-like protein 8 [Populus alba x Populus x berolinensis]